MAHTLLDPDLQHVTLTRLPLREDAAAEHHPRRPLRKLSDVLSGMARTNSKPVWPPPNLCSRHGEIHIKEHQTQAHGETTYVRGLGGLVLLRLLPPEGMCRYNAIPATTPMAPFVKTEKSILKLGNLKRPQRVKTTLKRGKKQEAFHMSQATVQPQ